MTVCRGLREHCALEGGGSGEISLWKSLRQSLEGPIGEGKGEKKGRLPKGGNDVGKGLEKEQREDHQT